MGSCCEVRAGEVVRSGGNATKGKGRDEREGGEVVGGGLACSGPELGRCGGRLRDGPTRRSAPMGWRLKGGTC